MFSPAKGVVSYLNNMEFVQNALNCSDMNANNGGGPAVIGGINKHRTADNITCKATEDTNSLN